MIGDARIVQSLQNSLKAILIEITYTYLKNIAILPDDMKNIYQFPEVHFTI